jgi:Tol biopolymer transport system component
MITKHYWTIAVSLIVFCIIVTFSSCIDDPSPNWFNYELFVNERDQYPAFSPDGEYIAYYHYSSQSPEPVDYPSGLYIVDRNGNNRVLVIEGQHENPAWSPDGKWLVFVTQGVIQKCKINGDSLTTFQGLENQSSSFEDALFFPDWTPDGKYILFDRAVNREGESNLYSMKADFADSRPIFGVIVVAGRDPELSPDNDRVVYMRATIEWPHWEIFSMDTLGTDQIQLTQNNKDNRGPTWAPDGLHIAWSSNIQIHTMNADGSNQRFLAYGQYPSWSVNNEIAFSHADATYKKEVLYTINPDGSNKKQITF